MVCINDIVAIYKLNYMEVPFNAIDVTLIGDRYCCDLLKWIYIYIVAGHPLNVVGMGRQYNWVEWPAYCLQFDDSMHA